MLLSSILGINNTISPQSLQSERDLSMTPGLSHEPLCFFLSFGLTQLQTHTTVMDKTDRSGFMPVLSLSVKSLSGRCEIMGQVQSAEFH